MALAGHQIEIHLDGHELVGDPQLCKQSRDGRAFAYLSRLTIDYDFHYRSLILAHDDVGELVGGPEFQRTVPGLVRYVGGAIPRNHIA